MRLPLALALIFSLSLHAEPALERGAEDTIKLRGQGPNPLAFAFAEEQFIKDLTCLPKGCPTNAHLWSASVFDIVKAHSQDDAAQTEHLLDKEGKNISGAKLLFTGSFSALPFNKLGLISVRASKCTLEQPLFRLNRSFALNPNRQGLYDHLAGIHKKIKAASEFHDADQLKELKVLQIQTLMGILGQLAATEKTAESFVSKVIAFTSCADTVQINKMEIEAKILTNEPAIRAELSELLKAKKPVMLGLCSEILEDDKSAATCSGHLVVAKDIKANKVLLVDSGFFSMTKKNADGSAWVSLETLIRATAKFGAQAERGQRETDGIKRAQQDFDSTTARLKRELEESLSGLTNQEESFAESVKETFLGLRKALARIPPAKFRDALVNALSKVQDGEEDEVDEIMIEEIEKLEFRTLADLAKIEPLLLASLKRNAQAAAEQLRQGGAGEDRQDWPTLEPAHNFIYAK